MVGGWVAAEVLSPPLSFADQAGEITATLPQLTIPGNEQETTILSLLLPQNFLLATDKTWLQLQRPLCKERAPDATETVSRSLFLSLDKLREGGGQS